MACHNCSGCCIHNKCKHIYHTVEHKNEKGEVWMVENVFDGYEHYCPKNPEGFKEWHRQHAHETYDTYKESVMGCYEPTETSRLLEEMITTADEILKNLKEKKDE